MLPGFPLVAGDCRGEGVAAPGAGVPVPDHEEVPGRGDAGQCRGGRGPDEGRRDGVAPRFAAVAGEAAVLAPELGPHEHHHAAVLQFGADGFPALAARRADAGAVVPGHPVVIGDAAVAVTPLPGLEQDTAGAQAQGPSVGEAGVLAGGAELAGRAPDAAVGGSGAHHDPAVGGHGVLLAVKERQPPVAQPQEVHLHDIAAAVVVHEDGPGAPGAAAVVGADADQAGGGVVLAAAGVELGPGQEQGSAGQGGDGSFAVTGVLGAGGCNDQAELRLLGGHVFSSSCAGQCREPGESAHQGRPAGSPAAGHGPSCVHGPFPGAFRHAAADPPVRGPGTGS